MLFQAKCLFEDSIIIAQSLLARGPVVRNPVLCIKSHFHPWCNVSTLGGWQCCEAWFHSTHPAPWWEWRSATGYLNIRGSQEHPFIVTACAPQQTDFLYQSHAHARRPQMLPWTGQRNQLTAQTCSISWSKPSICKRWHGTKTEAVCCAQAY